MLNGRRVHPWNGSDFLEPGEYARHPNGDWYACTPDDRLAALAKHTVTEHEDRTITVAPSIRVWGGGAAGEWHGFLERGVWRAC